MIKHKLLDDEDMPCTPLGWLWVGFFWGIVLGMVFGACVARASMDTWVQERVVWDNPQTAADISDLGRDLLLWAPIVDSVFNGNFKEVGLTYATIGGITYLTKVLSGRLRPDESNRRSFFSGHTSISFAGAGYICLQSKRLCPTAIILASTVGYLRLATNKHWTSDIIIGAGVGYAGGYFLPTVIASW